MPIPKVNDVVSFTGKQPWMGDWAQLKHEKYWIITECFYFYPGGYHFLRLRGLSTGFIPQRVNKDLRDGFPLELSEIVIEPFLTALQHALAKSPVE